MCNRTTDSGFVISYMHYVLHTIHGRLNRNNRCGGGYTSFQDGH